MNLVWAATGALAGLPVGTALRDPVFRLSVPSGTPEQSTCPCCAAPVSSWLAMRCGHCGRSLVTAGMLELPTSIVLALVLGRFSAHPVTLVFAFIGALGVALAVIDIRVQRLPDRLTLPAFPVLIALLAGAAAIGNDAGAFVRALLGGLVLSGSYLLLALLRPGQLGGGDIKLAGLAGLALGWLGWATLFIGAVLGFVLFAAVSLVLLAARRITLRSEISFGPFLLSGVLIAIFTAGAGR
jgi:leader peptidase (prepilin peptidase) / N-methyltransferase